MSQHCGNRADGKLEALCAVKDARNLILGRARLLPGLIKMVLGWSLALPWNSAREGLDQAELVLEIPADQRTVAM